MQIDVYSATGTKSKTMDLPATLFEAPLNWGLMHQAVTRQQNNRRVTTAHVKTRGEVMGSTKKLFAQKGTGRARRGSVRAPTLRGGGKVFGPRNDQNFVTDMPKKMRHAALRSCLSLQASKGTILGLEKYSDDVKTKQMAELFSKLPIELGRKVLVVMGEKQNSVALSARNIPGVKTITANYLNPEDILNARHVVFFVDAIKKAEELFGTTTKPEKKVKPKKESAKPKAAKKAAPKKKTSTPKAS